MNKFLRQITTSYANVWDIWRRYWSVYGGIRELLASPYTHLALGITLISWNTWTKPEWWELPLGMLPDLLGFTLGGLAVLLGLSEKEVLSILAVESAPTKETDLSIIVSAFIHFVVIQGIALICAVVCMNLHIPIDTVPFVPVILEFTSISQEAFAGFTQHIGWSVGFFLFAYSLTLVLATAMSVLRVSQILESIAKLGNDQR